MAYGDFGELARKTASDKILVHKALSFANRSKHDSKGSCLNGLYLFMMRNPLYLQINLLLVLLLKTKICHTKN